MTEYTSIETFYAADERRRISPEADYGVWWTEHEGARWPYWRVSYVQTTGEIYAEERGERRRVKLLGTHPADEEDIYYRSLERVLEGWSTLSVKSLSWVVEKLAEHDQ